MSDDTVSVVVYGAEWCPPCHTTKDYLKSKKVEYEYVNIDDNPDKGREISVKTGWSAIPIIQIGDKYILGFDRPKIDAALAELKLV
jgi:glutaredoxin 3